MARRGFSLLEVMIGMGLLGLLLALVMSVLWPFWRSAARLHVRTDLSARARMIARMVEADLARTTASGVASGASANTTAWVAIQPLDQVSADQEVVWAPQVIFYRWNAPGLLHRHTWPPGTGAPSVTSPATLLPEALASLALQAGNPGERLLASVISLFQLQPGGGGFQLHLKLTQDIPGSTTPEQFDLLEAIPMEVP